MKHHSVQDSSVPLEGLLPEENPVELTAPDRLRVGDASYQAPWVRRTLEPHVTPDRISRIERVVSRRTKSVAVVIEGIANAGNVSAVMRTAEAMGILAFHVVLGDVRYKTSKRTTQGAEKWLDVYRWDTPGECATYLRMQGYRLVAAAFENASPISDIDFKMGRTALVFGNEREGLSEAMLRECDERAVIPIYGFAQSFNISVAAAIAIYHVHRERTSRSVEGDLSNQERSVLVADYLMRSLASSDKLLRRAAGGPGSAGGQAS